MIDDDIVIDDDQAPGADEPPAEPVAVVPGPARPGSILDQVHVEVDDAADDQGRIKDLPVGKVRRLYARYRALGDDEIEDINKLAKRREQLRKRTGQDDVDIEGSNQRSAILLARACTMLLWRNDDGELVELHTALQEQGVEGIDGPLRYDRRLVPLFKLDDLEPDASSVDVAMRLHRWGQDNNYSPLRGTAQIVEMFSSGLSGEALEAALQGN